MATRARRRILPVALPVAVIAALVGALAPGSAWAMGTDDPYEDMQVGVTYTVYEPEYTGGLDVRRANGIPCSGGQDEALAVAYGSRRTTTLDVIQGRPLCADPGGIGKTVWTGRIQGNKAVMIAYCDETDATEWADCSRADVARVGGALTMVLPRTSGLRATEVALVTSGASPLTAQQLIRVGRSMQPVNG